eukprot:TRINITY_DN12002_c1_g1_i2.p3 TRINITY_DN12002_c1_g1~~TRINITY_DN12002_c1_g1_i2.p3  ORF type:complete len:127 (+),score=4.13 TRINITY_DN12002_c1_g1_i2:1803-2183(+)
MCSSTGSLVRPRGGSVDRIHVKCRVKGSTLMELKSNHKEKSTKIRRKENAKSTKLCHQIRPSLSQLETRQVKVKVIIDQAMEIVHGEMSIRAGNFALSKILNQEANMKEEESKTKRGLEDKKGKAR